MIIKQTVELELERIDIQENPIGHRGKYACFHFRMESPSSYYFFKRPTKIGDDDFSVVWGTSPTITFYTKNFKDWRHWVLEKIKTDLPDGIEMHHLGQWYLAISNYDKTYGNRPWAICYRAKTSCDAYRVQKSCERSIPVNAEFMESIVNKLPMHGRE